MSVIFFFSSRRRHTRCALVTGVQTCALPISTIRRFSYPLSSRHPGSKPNHQAVEAPKWRTARAERRAGKAGCLSKRLSARDGSHLDVPKGFDQNGPLLRREVLKYRHMSSPSLLELGPFASKLDGLMIWFGPYHQKPAMKKKHKKKTKKQRRGG